MGAFVLNLFAKVRTEISRYLSKASFTFLTRSRQTKPFFLPLPDFLLIVPASLNRFTTLCAALKAICNSLEIDLFDSPGFSTRK